MSSSSRPEAPSAGATSVRADRAQTEPIAALVAVLAIAIGLGLYAGVAAQQSPGAADAEPTRAESVMQRLTAGVLQDGVDDEPVLLDRFARPGEEVRVVIEYRRGTRTIYGPNPPPDADVARRPVTYRPRPGVQRALTITVWVWEP